MSLLKFLRSLYLDTNEDIESRQHPQRHLQQHHQQMGVFYVRYADRRVLPAYCHRPIGAAADAFIRDAMTERQRECVRKFMERERADEGESFLWFRDEAMAAAASAPHQPQITVLSLQTLENHFRRAHAVKRVNWRRTLSMSTERVSIYRYSLPVISTKFRLRVANFLARNYRCVAIGFRFPKLPGHADYGQ